MSVVDDGVAVAEANLEAANGVLGAAENLTATQLQDILDFLNSPPSGGGTPNFGSVTTVSGVFGDVIHLDDDYFANSPFGVPCVVCHGVTAQGIVGPPNSFRLLGGPATLEIYVNFRDSVGSLAVAAEVSSTALFAGALVGPSVGSSSLLSFTPAQLAGSFGLSISRVNVIAHDFLTRGAAIAYSPETASALMAYRLIAMRIIETYQQSGAPSTVGMETQLLRIQMIEQQLAQWGVPF